MHDCAEIGAALLHIERRRYLLERQPEPDHLEGHLGWMPTMTVWAPLRRAMYAGSRKVRAAKEPITSSGVTSTMTPRPKPADPIDQRIA